VSCEWFCYLLASVVVPLLMRLRSGAFAALAAWLLLLAAYFILAALGLRELHASAGLGLVRIGAEFFSGCLLCIAWQRGYAANRALRAVRYAAVACMLVFSVFPAALLVVLAGWALILTLVKDPRSWLRARPVVYIGEISYSIYMLHWAVLVVVDGLSRRRQIPDLGAFQFVYVLVAVLALSVATYHFVERPARALLRRLSPGPNLTRIGARHPPPGGRHHIT
jgi:peptidoglycan/LPS O-acetylase OafA/YrhL